ncbi:hypothetical protein SDC9_167300 [bioreactor metagenome]|uniref:Uncharacterized protein n=1 Tax=bioreactor metagenome TaxID=1076179 RepID=A0A645FZV7_9ZZZZ
MSFELFRKVCVTVKTCSHYFGIAPRKRVGAGDSETRFCSVFQPSTGGSRSGNQLASHTISRLDISKDVFDRKAEERGD